MKPRELSSARRAAADKFFITEIINALHRHGFEQGGKAQTMLYNWAAELRERARPVLKPSKLRSEFNKISGKGNW